MARVCGRCSALIATGTTCTCMAHQESQRSRRRRHTEAEQRVVNSHAWKRVRSSVRHRDQDCVHADGTCTGRLEVHHRVPVSAGGSAYDMTNLVTLCQHHHRIAESQTRQGSFWHPKHPSEF